jgi:hypothetical protein
MVEGDDAPVVRGELVAAHAEHPRQRAAHQ